MNEKYTKILPANTAESAPPKKYATEKLQMDFGSVAAYAKSKVVYDSICSF